MWLPLLGAEGTRPREAEMGTELFLGQLWHTAAMQKGELVNWSGQWSLTSIPHTTVKHLAEPHSMRRLTDSWDSLGIFIT